VDDTKSSHTGAVSIDDGANPVCMDAVSPAERINSDRIIPVSTTYCVTLLREADVSAAGCIN
jgi:hypothetical protein